MSKRKVDDIYRQKRPVQRSSQENGNSEQNNPPADDEPPAGQGSPCIDLPPCLPAIRQSPPSTNFSLSTHPDSVFDSSVQPVQSTPSDRANSQSVSIAGDTEPCTSIANEDRSPQANDAAAGQESRGPQSLPVPVEDGISPGYNGRGSRPRYQRKGIARPIRQSPTTRLKKCQTKDQSSSSTSQDDTRRQTGEEDTEHPDNRYGRGNSSDRSRSSGNEERSQTGSSHGQAGSSRTSSPHGETENAEPESGK